MTKIGSGDHPNGKFKQLKTISHKLMGFKPWAIEESPLFIIQGFFTSRNGKRGK